MNGILKILGVFVGSFVVVLLFALLAVVFKPDVFRVLSSVDPAQPVVAGTQSMIDSVTATMVPVDSIRQVIKELGRYRTLQAAMADTIRTLSALLHEEQVKIQEFGNVLRTSVSAEDSARSAARQSLADFLGSMNAEEAASILRNMEDKEAREVLLRVKKRQAGKLLSTLDPAEAVKIMR